MADEIMALDRWMLSIMKVRAVRENRLASLNTTGSIILTIIRSSGIR